MNRRKFLTVTAVAVGAGLSGCMDSNTGSGSNPNDNSGGGGSDRDKSDNRSQTKTTSNRQEKQQILDLYNNGTRASNRGANLADNAVQAGNEKQHERAIQLYQDAQTKFTTARNKFSDAVAIAIEIQRDDVKEICENAERYSAISLQAVRVGERASKAARDGDIERHNELINEYNELTNEATRISRRTPKELEEILGLN